MAAVNNHLQLFRMLPWAMGGVGMLLIVKYSGLVSEISRSCDHHVTCDLTVHSISSVIRRPLPPNLSRGNSEGCGSRGVARLSSRRLAHSTGQTIASLEPHPSRYHTVTTLTPSHTHTQTHTDRRRC